MSGDTVRVRLDGDYANEFFDDRPELWWDRDPERVARVAGVYELPREQVERWRAAGEAWKAAQGEMRALMAERSQRRIAARDPDEIAREQAERWRAAADAQAEAQRWGEASRETVAVMTERWNRQIAERRAEIQRGVHRAER